MAKPLSAGEKIARDLCEMDAPIDNIIEVDPVEVARRIDEEVFHLVETIATLQSKSAALLVTIEAKDAALKTCERKVTYIGVGLTEAYKNYDTNLVSEALALSPSTELLEARDRKRDAKLIHQINGSIYSLDTNNRLFDLAKRRESGEWQPEL